MLTNEDKSPSLPKLITPVLDNVPHIDNLFCEVWKQLRVPTLLSWADITKRSGHEASVLVFWHLV